MRDQLFDNPLHDEEAPLASAAGRGYDETKGEDVSRSEKTFRDSSSAASSSKKRVGEAMLGALGLEQQEQEQAGFAVEELAQDGLDMDGFSTDEEERTSSKKLTGSYRVIFYVMWWKRTDLLWKMSTNRIFRGKRGILKITWLRKKLLIVVSTA